MTNTCKSGETPCRTRSTRAQSIAVACAGLFTVRVPSMGLFHGTASRPDSPQTYIGWKCRRCDTLVYTSEQIRAMRNKLPAGAPAWTDEMVVAYVTTNYDLVDAGNDKAQQRAESGYAQ